MRTKVPVILLSVLALLFHACGGKDTQDKQELSVSTSQVTALPQNGNKEFPFIARPFRTSELSFRVGGPIDRFDVYAGNRYERGNIIAEIDPRDFRIRKEDWARKVITLSSASLPDFISAWASSYLFPSLHSASGLWRCKAKAQKSATSICAALSTQFSELY